MLSKGEGKALLPEQQNTPLHTVKNPDQTPENTATKGVSRFGGDSCHCKVVLEQDHTYISAKVGENHSGSQEPVLKGGGPRCEILAGKETTQSCKAEPAFASSRHELLQRT